ncbi:MAG: hypothetical protein LBB56_08380, partial [Chitinispirillales bacterium]|nr:hypothetical protein [Chitinispirillales bacterium]
MNNKKSSKLIGHSKTNDFLFKEIDETTYKQLTELSSTLIYLKMKFEAAKEKAKEITIAVNERNKSKSSDEPL